MLVGWSWVPLAIPLISFNNLYVAALSLSVGIFLNPAGNSGIGACRLHVTPPKLLGRVQAVTQFVVYATLPLYPVLAGLALDAIGGPAAIELFLALTAVGLSSPPSATPSARYPALRPGHQRAKGLPMNNTLTSWVG